MASSPITSWQMDGETVRDFIFLGSKITADGDCRHEIKRCLLLGRKAMAILHSILKSRDFANKGPSGQSYGFSSSHVCMWELDHKGSWAPKNWCFWTVVLEKTLKSPLDCKKIKPVNPKGNQFWIFRLMLKLTLQYFGHLMGRTDSLANTLMLGKIEGRKRRGQEDETAGWHHWLNGHEFEQALGDCDGQGSLERCSPWGQKELDRTERVNSQGYQPSDDRPGATGNWARFG